MNALNALVSLVIRVVKAVASRKVLLSLVGLGLTALVAFGYIAIYGLRFNPLHRTIAVRIMLPESGGLLTNQDVTLRGIPIGHVAAVNLTDHGVEAVASIDSSARIPADSPVRVSGLSAAGEQYLDFRPDHGNGPYLTDGAVISGKQASIPITLPHIIDHSRGALAQLDADKLGKMFNELHVTKDGPRKLAALLDGATLLANTVDSVLPETMSMIRSTRVVFSTVADVGPGLRDTTKEAAQVLGGVNRMDGGFRTLVDRGEPQLASLDNLIADNRQNVVQLLGNLTTVSQIVYERVPALQYLWRPDRDRYIDRLFAPVHDGGIWALADIYPRYRCDYNLPKGVPSDASFPEPYKYTYCDNQDPAVLVRGARNAPRPPGDDTAGPPPGYDPHAVTDKTPNYPPYTIQTPYGGPTMPVPMPN
ncbi:MlaD family protein [Mycobacterium sp. OTB74]|jgi:virulence factor Mce-like protein|uniref:MlaD family protein n=1 Tax=Mycobacterium sp. OTB74 TaxID=1853452 RepID=UPI0024764756|nr:MlaD family protein [Mycobacterium sp. OTB74]MDH6242571.1 virulence factor Mce-like protein [Mycobacterium sp. OTB74]